MRVLTGGNRLIVTTGHNIFSFDLSTDVDKNLKYEIDSIIKYNELLADHAIGNEIRQLLSKYKPGNDN